jgi:hypothetical protein
LSHLIRIALALLLLLPCAALAAVPNCSVRPPKGTPKADLPKLAKVSQTDAGRTVVGTVAGCHPVGENAVVETTSPPAATCAEDWIIQPSLSTTGTAGPASTRVSAPTPSTTTATADGNTPRVPARFHQRAPFQAQRRLIGSEPHPRGLRAQSLHLSTVTRFIGLWYLQ